MTTALIIGGGIAGPATAMALRQVGIDAQVYEAYAESAALEVGSYLTVAVNGLDALRSIGALQPVLDTSFPSQSIELFSGTGKRLGETSIGGTLPDGTVTRTLKRVDLYRVIHDEAIRRGIAITHNKRLVGAEVSPAGGVVARFADGTQASGDLLIGADGVHSMTRRIIDPTTPRPRYTGLGNIGGITRDVPVAGVPGVYRMIFGKRAFFGYTVSPSGEVWWFANPPSAKELSREELAALTSDDWKQRLMRLFADDAGPAVEIIRATTEAIRGVNSYDLPSAPRWSRGPMLIIGDAAHAVSPSSGQGASMAIEDAVTLARCLRDLPDPVRAFAAFERLRRARVERVVAFGARASSNKIPGPFSRFTRDLLLPVFLKRATNPAATSWLFNHHVDFAAPVESVATRA